MAANTAYLGGLTTLSQLSLTDPSGATLTASDGTFGGNVTIQGTLTQVGAVTQTGAEYLGDGTALAPTQAYSSEKSLGFYRSAASVEALSYGFLQAPYFLSTTTTSSSASTLALPNKQGMISFAVLSATSAQLQFRSANTVYVWNCSSYAS